MSNGPVIVSVASIALGATLGIVHHRVHAWLDPIRTFGLVSVLGLILLVLLPEALAAYGVYSLPMVAGGYLVPALLDRFEHQLSKNDDKSRLGAEVGYLLILLHQFVDGIALSSEGSYVQGTDHWDALIAMSVHTVPLTTLVVLGFTRRSGPAEGMVRAVGIMCATLLGIGSVHALSQSVFEAVHPWLGAAVSGMLLHVIADEPGPALHSRFARIRDTAAAGAGIALVTLGLAGSHRHSDAGAAFSESLIHAFGGLSLSTAPALLFGLAAGAAIAAFGAPIAATWLNSGRRSLDAARGAIIGAPLPVCSCGVLPVAEGLRKRGGSTAFVLAFLVATPEIGVDAFVLSTQFLGWELSLIRLVTALMLAMIAGIVGAVLAQELRQGPNVETSPDKASCCAGGASLHHGHEHKPQPRQWMGQFFSELDELVFHIGPWTLFGLGVAAYAEAAIPAGGWESTRSGFDIIIVSLLAIPSYVCAASMTPLAAVLLLKGFSPGAVIAGLLLGPATNVATFAFVRHQLGVRGVTFWTATLMVCTWLMAWGVNQLASVGWFAASASHAAAHLHGVAWYELGALAILGALIARGIWQVGIGNWIRSLRNFTALTGSAQT